MMRLGRRTRVAVLCISIVVLFAFLLRCLLIAGPGGASRAGAPPGARVTTDSKTSERTPAAPQDAAVGEVRPSREEDGHQQQTVTFEGELPSPVSDLDIEVLRSGMSARQIYHMQDRFIRNYPPYEELRDRLRRELAAELDVNGLSSETLIARAGEMRASFWQDGGNLSADACLHAYRARALLELAYEREPDNLRVADGLVETIQSTHPRWIFAGTGSDEKIIHADLQARLLEIRTRQFSQLEKEVAAGRKPTWEDFLRTCDLSLLLGTEEDYERAKQIVQWQIDHSADGDWTFYMDRLQRKMSMLCQSRNSNFGIYTNVDPASFPREYLYGRRLPSFLGPEPERRGKTPCHAVRGELITMRDF